MPTQGIMPLSFHRLSFSLWFSPRIASLPLPLPFYFSVPLVFRTGTIILFPTFHSLYGLSRGQPLHTNEPIFHIAIGCVPCFLFMILTAMALPMQLRSHDHFLSSFTSSLCRRLAHLMTLPFTPQLPGALALSLEHMVYSPQKTDAFTMPITCDARKRCLDFCHNIRPPPCQVRLYPIPAFNPYAVSLSFPALSRTVIHISHHFLVY